MRSLVKNFPNQLEDAIKIGKSIGPLPPCVEIKNIVITGMGGSGIGGKIVSQYFSRDSQIPLFANADYDLPAFVGNNTLLIISSYSGNTEETIEAFEKGIERGCQIACVSSGGEVKRMAEERKIPFVEIPSGFPPRSMFAYSFVQQLFLLHSFGLIENDFIAKLETSQKLLMTHAAAIEEETVEIANNLKGRIPVLYGDTWLEGVLVRCRQQLNENSKMLCWHHTFPEMNHNELVGWESADNRIAVLVFKSEYDHPRSKKRMDICQPIFDSKCDRIFHIHAKGKSRLEQIFFFVLWGDWLSIHLSELNEVDATEIKNIIYLKDALKS